MGVPLTWFGGGVAFHQWHLPARDDRGPRGRARRQRPALPRAVGDVWPMAGWLTDLDRRGWVHFDPHGDVLVAT